MNLGEDQGWQESGEEGTQRSKAGSLGQAAGSTGQHGHICAEPSWGGIHLSLKEMNHACELFPLNTSSSHHQGAQLCCKHVKKTSPSQPHALCPHCPSHRETEAPAQVGLKPRLCFNNLGLQDTCESWG